MRTISFAAMLALAAADAEGFGSLSHKIKRHVNRTWEPVEDSDFVFAGKSTEELQRILLGTIVVDEQEVPVESPLLSSMDLPDSFDARTQWPNCIHPVRTQGDCGGCWAFAATEVLSDNLCIASKEATNVVLSVQDVIACDQTDWGCNGGQPQNVWKFLETTGAVADSCIPYISADAKTNGTCSTTCSGSGSYKKYTCAHTNNKVRGPDQIKQILMTDGPAHTVMLVWQDLLKYKTGVYKHLEGNLMGPHSVKVIGWGKDGDTEYWVVQNSWGAKWGMDGFFNIDMNDFGSSICRGGIWNCGGATIETVVV